MPTRSLWHSQCARGWTESGPDRNIAYSNIKYRRAEEIYKDAVWSRRIRYAKIEEKESTRPECNWDECQQIAIRPSYAFGGRCWPGEPSISPNLTVVSEDQSGFANEPYYWWLIPLNSFFDTITLPASRLSQPRRRHDDTHSSLISCNKQQLRNPTQPRPSNNRLYPQRFHPRRKPNPWRLHILNPIQQSHRVRLITNERKIIKKSIEVAK